jgi:protein-disulfide isomerase
MIKKCLVALFIAVTTSPLLAQSEVACVRGRPNAPIRIEVFSDFQCPACRAFYLQTMRQIFTNYADTGKVCVVYRAYPNFRYSREAARFAHAALRIGPRQWVAVADALFEKQPQWAETGDVEAVVASALDDKDMVSLRKYLDDPAMEEAIANDIILGSRRQVRSTPTFFLTANGETEKVEAALTYAAMQLRLEEILKQ